MVNWNALLNREIKPPFVPILKSELDVSNFDPVILLDNLFRNSLKLK